MLLHRHRPACVPRLTLSCVCLLAAKPTALLPSPSSQPKHRPPRRASSFISRGNPLLASAADGFSSSHGSFTGAPAPVCTNSAHEHHKPLLRISSLLAANSILSMRPTAAAEVAAAPAGLASSAPEGGQAGRTSSAAPPQAALPEGGDRDEEMESRECEMQDAEEQGLQLSAVSGGCPGVPH